MNELLSLRDFKMICPPFEMGQNQLLSWIVEAHVLAEEKAQGWMKGESAATIFAQKLRDDLLRIGLGEDKIRKRAFELRDCLHQNWEEMEIYSILSMKEGSNLDKKMELFSKATYRTFEQFYPDEEEMPPHLIHVTCTGYVGPSPAQRRVADHPQGRDSMVTHAYHMGCHGAVAAVRMAMGHYLLTKTSSDIVHTELCSLHMNPAAHTLEQLVVQSLFGDGLIRYTCDGKREGARLHILSTLERVIEGTSEKMGWNCAHWGFQMSLSKEVPFLIANHIENFLSIWADRLQIPIDQFHTAHFAIHPGGPKIIDQIAKRLNLTEGQISHSRGVLRDHGNMSSATLPHIWHRMIDDPSILPGEKIVSLAFGPGLSICGLLLEKEI